MLVFYAQLPVCSLMGQVYVTEEAEGFSFPQPFSILIAFFFCNVEAIASGTMCACRQKRCKTGSVPFDVLRALLTGSAESSDKP